MKVKVTNSGLCPRGVWALGVIKLVGIGASRELILTDSELEEAKKIEILAFEEVEGSGDEEKADLLAKLKALGINANANSKPETLRAKLEEAEAAKASADADAALKLEVIAELKGLNVEVDEAASLADLQAALATAKA